MAGLLSPEDADRFATLAQRDEPASIAALDTGRVLREAIFEIFQALSGGQPADPEHLDVITDLRVDGMKHAALSMGHDGFVFAVAAEVDTLTRPLWQIAESATQVLLSDDWRRVRLCPGDDCGWLFLDQTKNGNRRWCDSADCGNRVRGRAYTQRHRQRSQSDSM
jgi:predicted RNA-binding Zn ribbon-like protein